jgi:hypothetical protein
MIIKEGYDNHISLMVGIDDIKSISLIKEKIIIKEDYDNHISLMVGIEDLKSISLIKEK